MNRILKKVVYSLLLLLILSLVGCNNNKEMKDLIKQNVYSYENIPFEIDTENHIIKAMTYSNDRVIACIDSSIYDDEMFTSKFQMDIYSCNMDGSDMQRIQLQKDSEENDVAHSWIDQVNLNEDGSVLAITGSYIEDYSDPENPFYEYWLFLKCWNADGTLHWSKNFDELGTNPEEYIYISNMFTDTKGNTYLLCNDNQTTLITLNEKGKVTNSKKLDQRVKDIYMKNDDTIFIISYDDNWTELNASIYNPITDTLGEPQQLPTSLGNADTTSSGETTDFILSDNIGIYSFNLGDAETKPIMNNINSNLATSGFETISMIDDNHFIGAYSDISTDETQIAIFTKVNPDDIPDKEILILGVSYLQSSIAEQVTKFNKDNEKYHITIRDYSTFNTSRDYNASYRQMNQDIITGNMPDMLFVNSDLPISDYVAKGLLADIGKLIEQDEELSKEEYIENVFQAYSINDKLYHVISSFTVGTVIAKESIVGDHGWTMEDMQNIKSDLPYGSSIFSNEIIRWQFLDYAMSYLGSDFINVSTGRCNFDSEEFVKVLELAKTIPEEMDGSYYNEESYWDDYQKQYRNNSTIVMPVSLNFTELNYFINGCFDGDFTFVGFPNENKNGSVVQVYTSYIISSKCKNIDVAWEFLRKELTDETQENIYWGFPVNKDILLSKAQEAMKQSDDIEEEFPPLTQEQMDRVLDFIETVDRPLYNNTEIFNIVKDGAEPFFSGQKDAAEVAKIIQNRVQLYINENRY